MIFRRKDNNKVEPVFGPVQIIAVSHRLKTHAPGQFHAGLREIGIRHHLDPGIELFAVVV